MRTPTSWLLAALLGLGGCKLIDQRTFERTPQAPSPAALNTPALPPLPLARLQPANPDSDWRARVDGIVQQVLARNPDAQFDLLTPIPTSASRKIQDGYQRAGTEDAQAVATAMQEDRVDAAHITIGFQGDPGTPTREVRVFVH